MHTSTSIFYTLINTDGGKEALLQLCTQYTLDPDDILSLCSTHYLLHLSLLSTSYGIENAWIRDCKSSFATKRLSQATMTLERDLMDQGLGFLFTGNACLLNTQCAIIAGGYPLKFLFSHQKDEENRRKTFIAPKPSETSDIDIYFLYNTLFDMDPRYPDHLCYPNAHREYMLNIPRLTWWYKTLERHSIVNYDPNDELSWTPYAQCAIHDSIHHHTIHRKDEDRSSLDLCCVKPYYFEARHPRSMEFALRCNVYIRPEHIVENFNLSCCQFWYTPSKGIQCLSVDQLWETCRMHAHVVPGASEKYDANQRMSSEHLRDRFFEKYKKKGFEIIGDTRGSIRITSMLNTGI